uniref:Taf7l2 n=1 Tax=Peromyscus maniculatus bairdii TaxID=230844 RepID=A0A8C8W787_PERMB
MAKMPPPRAEMSENHDDDELPPELENQFILRLPPEQASRVRQIIRSGNAAMRERLKIDLSPDARHAVLQVDDVSLSARVVDLPCVIGSLKTHDRKTFYKTADISQMLVCSHGITPPLKNVRKKRFRKPTRKLPDGKQSEGGCGGYVDSKDVEKEVKRLLRSDAEAISSRWEIAVDDETKAVQSPACIPGLPVPTEISGHSSSECAVPQNTFRDSSRQDDNQEKDEDEFRDSSQEDGEEEEEDDLERELQTKFIEFSLCEANEGRSSIILEIQKLIHYKEKKLQKIQGKARRQKDLLRKLENLTLKSHFQSELEQLKLQEKQKYEQIIFLQEQLKYFVKK